MLFNCENDKMNAEMTEEVVFLLDIFALLFAVLFVLRFRAFGACCAPISANCLHLQDFRGDRSEKIGEIYSAYPAGTLRGIAYPVVKI